MSSNSLYNSFHDETCRWFFPSAKVYSFQEINLEILGRILEILCGPKFVLCNAKKNSVFVAVVNFVHVRNSQRFDENLQIIGAKFLSKVCAKGSNPLFEKPLCEPLREVFCHLFLKNFRKAYRQKNSGALCHIELRSR